MLRQLKEIFGYRKEEKLHEGSRFWGFAHDLFNRGYPSLSFYQAVKYYRQCAPLFTGIEMISDEFASIPLHLFNNQEMEYLEDDNPIINLINMPNADLTGDEFLKQIAAYYLITGNVFIIATGNINNIPKELFIVPSQYVRLYPGKDGYTETIEVSYETGMADVFKRKEVNGRFRYFVDNDKEIWHIRTFNPHNNSQNLYGMSKLLPITYEIEQYIQASVHNESLLKRGARVSGALVNQGTLTDDQFMRLQEQVNNFFSGSENAGRPMLLEDGVDFKEMSMSNKDMDFLELKKNVTSTIYNTLKIPLPLISPDHMTLNNMSTAKLNLYDNAVLPLASRMYNELSLLLLSRTQNMENITITHSPDEISALEPRRNEELNKLKDLGVLTINEIRAKLGYESLNGGDVIYGNSTQIPLARDQFTEDNLEEPEPMDREKLFKLMKKQMRPDGSRKFSDEYINNLADEYGF